MYYTDKEIIYINSLNRSSGTDANFTYSIKLNPLIKYDKVVLLSACIPKSYYLIQDGFNTFTLVENSATYIIALTPGNYTRTSVVKEIISQLNDSGTSYTYNCVYQNILKTYDDGKLLFTIAGNGSDTPQFIFSDNLLNEVMGFDINSTNTFSVAGSEPSFLKSTNVINLNQENTVFLHSDIIINREDDILQHIIVADNTNYSYINFEQNRPLECSKEISRTNTQSFRFRLTNENNKELDLNGQTYNMVLMIYKSTDTQKTLSLINEFIKMIALSFQDSLENDNKNEEPSIANENQLINDSNSGV